MAYDIEYSAAGAWGARSEGVAVAVSRSLLEATAATHQRFTELSLADASLADLVSAVAELADAQVVLSDVLHQVVAIDARGGSAEQLIVRWQQIELQSGALYKTLIDASSEVAVVRVEVKRRLRGRLALLGATPVSAVQVMVLQRGAAAIAMRLNGVSEESVRDGAHRSLLTDLLATRTVIVEAAAARASALGHDIGGAAMAVVVIECDDGAIGRQQIERVFAHADLDALVGELGGGRWGVLVMLPEANDSIFDRAAEMLQSLASSSGWVIRVARGGYVDELAGIRRSYAEAVEVADAVREIGSTDVRHGCYTMRDVGLRGLLVALRDDPRVLAFAERTLRPLMERDRREAGCWVHTLEVYLRLGGNKSITAIELGISRQTLYQRLSRIRRMLELDIDDAETRTSLHAAVMAIDGAARRRAALKYLL